MRHVKEGGKLPPPLTCTHKYCPTGYKNSKMMAILIEIFTTAVAIIKRDTPPRNQTTFTLENIPSYNYVPFPLRMPSNFYQKIDFFLIPVLPEIAKKGVLDKPSTISPPHPYPTS